ncbi:hypothetical protein CC1G_14442 [Coprinopsis cinerea okayama7|uniref:Uncharacterized protein n=1 Tax=Coprinopsis cinerea (strain Okayama-7 / 130 / ATCC MYA-4618 / FGSC 9003) TaxID=240176 RepID=D6RLT7_COPC7|nr:hypothetical protein CC1G_14442 [Coprinopsis cinerea okayama7\|eukprot:XP_002911445.1 hypothetical protein CC1G_14442 [Coprinopsis cinerea okayama7\
MTIAKQDPRSDERSVGKMHLEALDETGQQSLDRPLPRYSIQGLQHGEETAIELAKGEEQEQL